MFSCFIRHFIFSLISFSVFGFNSAFIFHVTKDTSSLQYVVKVRYGTPSVPVKLMIDLNVPFSWSDCSSSSSSSSSASHRPIHFRSLQCSTANIKSRAGMGSVKSGSGTDCGLSMTNPISKVSSWGYLVEETVAVDYINRPQIDKITTVDHRRILSYCTPTLFLHGLGSGTKGVLGLGNTRMAIQSQLTMSYGLDRKFSICLSPSKGFVNIGSWPHISTSKTKADVSRLLTYTPLVTKSSDDNEKSEYFINVMAIAINGQRILLPMARHEPLRAKISTTVPYTTMESSIYDAFVKAYIALASSMNMTRVSANKVEPFSVCFKIENIDKKADRTTMPGIDLILQSEMVKWRITGSNSLVKVNDELMCLAFLDGGSNWSPLIVIGGYQLEENFLQFDAATSMLGFSSSLLARGFTCSNLQNYTSLSMST